MRLRPRKGTLTLDRLRDAVDRRRDRDRGRRLHRPLRPPDGQALRRRDVRRRDRRAHGTHACDYLLTIDMEMEPVPGYQLRQLGAGLRRLPPRARPRTRCGVASWLEKTRARAVRRRTDERARTSHVADRAALDPAPQVDAARRARLRRVRRLRARVLPLPNELPRRRRGGLPRPRARRLVPRGLPHPAGHAHRGRTPPRCAAT